MSDLFTPWVLDLFAGPGGWDQGARDAGLDLSIFGVDNSPAACATARAAGYNRALADAMTLNLTRFDACVGLIASPPCPTWSAAGRHSAKSDAGLVGDTVTAIGAWVPDEYGDPARWSDVEWPEIVGMCRTADPRTALFAAAMWAATRLPRLEWIAMEQVPAARELFDDMAIELESIGWSTEVATICASDLGLPVRRKRVYLTARYGGPTPLVDWTPGPRVTAAQALGWPPGHRMVARPGTGGGKRQTFSTDGPSWALTRSARSWKRDDGVPLTAAQAGRLQGFPLDYPWTGTKAEQFLQIADVVLPPIAGRVLTAVTQNGRKQWDGHENRPVRPGHDSSDKWRIGYPAA